MHSSTLSDPFTSNPTHTRILSRAPTYPPATPTLPLSLSVFSPYTWLPAPCSPSLLSADGMGKASVHHMTRIMALEMARHSISVNGIAPGYFATEMNEDFFMTAKGQRYVKERVPFGRLGQLDELGEVLLLLAGPGSSFTTGVVIPVDGGHVNSAL